MAIRGNPIISVSQALINFIIGNMLKDMNSPEGRQSSYTAGQAEKIDVRQVLCKKNVTYSTEQVSLKQSPVLERR